MSRPRLPQWWKRYRAWRRRQLRVVKVIIACLTVMVMISTLLGIEASTRIGLSDEPSVVRIEGTGKPGLGITVVGPASVSGLAHSAGMMSKLTDAADDVTVIENARDLFNADKVVDATIAAISTHQEVTFVVTSMGGMLAYDVIKKLRSQGDTRHFGVVLIDAPAISDDVIGVPWIAKQFSWIPLGRTANTVTNPPFDRNAPAKIDDDANRQQLEALWRSYETWTMSSWGDQGDYVFSHDNMEKLPGVTWYFIQSELDTFVGKSAYANWEATQGLMPRAVVPEGVHAGVLNRPSLYNEFIANGIRHVASVA